MRRGQAAPASDFYCTRCGSLGIPIARKAGRGREAGHLKKLYCCKCKTETNHVECKSNTHYSYCDFLIEYKYGNFDVDGNRKEPYPQFRNKLYKEGVL